jgi:hypothetical protein
MWKPMQQLTQPFSSVSKQPWPFCVWWLVAIVVGSAGFWLPILLVWQGGGAADETLRLLVYAGTLASFTIVLLADGVASLLGVVGAGSNIAAAGMRGLAGGVAILLVLVEVGILGFTHAGGSSSHTSVGFQLFLAVLAITLASYLYCFRFPAWEPDVDDVKEKEDKEVKGLSASARRKASDEEGTKL